MKQIACRNIPSASEKPAELERFELKLNVL